MATDRIGKLYAGLTSKESALLAFTHLSKRNTAEVDRIIASVPLKVYRMLDDDHVQWVEGFKRMTMFFALEYWRYSAHNHAAQGMLLYLYRAVEDEAEDMVDPVLEGWKHWETCLMTLQAALKAVCDKHGVDVNVVRSFASIEDSFRPIGFGEIDPKLLEEMTTAFEDLLPKHD
jgi:hypothetical protein